MVKIVWTNQAYLDLKDIFDYISKDSKRYAHLQIKRVRDRVKILKENPESGRIVPEVAHPKIRELIEGSYRIIYKLKDPERIDILTVHHSARLLKIEKL